MKQKTKDELIRDLMQENAALKDQASQNAANLDYVAMMAEIDIPVEESEA